MRKRKLTLVVDNSQKFDSRLYAAPFAIHALVVNEQFKLFAAVLSAALTGIGIAASLWSQPVIRTD